MPLSTMLMTTYVFIDQDDNILEECEFRDDTPAEQHGLRLMKKHNKVIGVYKELVILDPDVKKG